MAGGGPPSPPVPVTSGGEVVHTLLMIGDAGGAEAGDPVLAALERAAAAAPDRTTVIFLGDNIYPHGMPAPGDPGRPEAEARLQRQLDAVIRSGATGYLVPGNHDWATQGPDGWAAVRRQAELVERQGGGRLALLPAAGCPGPEVREAGPIRLVLLDSSWWFHSYDRPGPGSGCLAASAVELEGALRSVLAAGAGRPVVLVTHHPLASSGAHGGRFNVRQHLFPLTDLAGWAWLPLPLVGSLYPGYRALGFATQDLASGTYRAWRELLARAMEGNPPALVASGHEHSLQVMEGRPWLAVSGAGYVGHGSPAGWLAATRYASSGPGFMRLDALADGRLRLAVIEVARGGEGAERWSAWLPASSRPSRPSRRSRHAA